MSVYVCTSTRVIYFVLHFIIDAKVVIKAKSTFRFVVTTVRAALLGDAAEGKGWWSDDDDK